MEREDWWWALETDRRRRRVEALVSIEDPEARRATLTAEVRLCAADPVYWIENYGWMYDPKQQMPERRTVPVVLWPKQRELVAFLLDALRAKRSALIMKGRELGVTWICLLLSYHLFRDDPGFSAKIGSRKEELVDNRTLDSMFGKLRFIHNLQPLYLRPPVQDNHLRWLNTETKSELVGEATNRGFARGGRRRLLILDEFAHVEASLQSLIWTALESVSSSIWVPSTPSGPGVKFSQLYETLPDECVFEMDWRSDPRRSEDFRVERLRSGMTEDEFSQEHEAKVVTLRSGRVFSFRRDVVEYHDHSPDFAALNEPRKRMPLVGGWDFGSGASLLVNFLSLVELNGMAEARPRIWVDDELTWQQASWRLAAGDTLALGGNYGARRCDFGDPAGRQPESDQASWEQNLRTGGVPLFCLDDHFNSRDGIEWMLKLVQAMLQEGSLRIHRRCGYLWSCLENWSREVPRGLELDFISRTYIPPRHDVYSHGGMALCYLVAGAMNTAQAAATLRNATGERQRATAEMPERAGGTIARRTVPRETSLASALASQPLGQIASMLARRGASGPDDDDLLISP